MAMAKSSVRCFNIYCDEYQNGHLDEIFSSHSKVCTTLVAVYSVYTIEFLGLRKVPINRVMLICSVKAASF